MVVEKNDLKTIHCPWRRKKNSRGQSRVATLPVEEKKEQPRSKQRGCIARGGEKRTAVVKAEWLLPVEKKKEQPRSKQRGCIARGGEKRAAVVKAEWLLPVEEKKELPWSKQSGCIARGGEKRAVAVQAEWLHCSWRRKKSCRGPSRAAALPVEEKKELPWSKQ